MRSYIVILLCSMGKTNQIVSSLLLIGLLFVITRFKICFVCNTQQAYLLFGDEEYLYIFQEAYKAAMQYLHHDPW
jgi:hypothetical protein